MACCHSLTFISDDLVGDPLDIKMFNLTSWILDETNSKVGGNSPLGGDDIVLASVRPQITSNGSTTSSELAIVRRFDFESKL